jgi:amphi-Trp domain-containing protein
MVSTIRSGEFDHESLQDTESIGKYLEALAAGFRSGTLQFSSGKKAIRLKPNGLLELSLKVKRKSGDSRIHLNVSWKEPKKRKESDEPPLKIQTGKRG